MRVVATCKPTIFVTATRGNASGLTGAGLAAGYMVDVQTLTSSSTIFVATNCSTTSLNCVDSGSTNNFRDSQLINLVVLG